ncbi:MAG: NADH-quinone oxidoreductase subunit M [Acidobacteria bacterium]|nr:NADH-quinone oxidoreductase subunit M [Acidobacteriota bacterium]
MRWLTWTVWTPLAGALLLALLHRSWHTAIRWWALVVSLATFGLSVGILASFDKSEAGFQLVERHSWIRSFGASYKLGVDGISLFLVLLTTFLVPICVLASWNVSKNPKLFMGFLLALETAVLGVFLSLDLLLFMVFWDAALVPMYFLIGTWGHERRVYAAVKFFLFTLLGGVLMLAGILVLWAQVRGRIGVGTFDLEVIERVPLPLGMQRWLFLAFFAAFAIKVPLFPLHTWLPDAHTEAPTAGSVILAAVLLKMGTYGFLRYSLPLFPEAAREAAPWIAALALVGITYGAIVAAIQRDLKRLVAYSSVAHLGFVVLGIFAFTVIGMQGATLQMINHGLSTGGLFLLVGMLYERRHTRRISDFGGIASVAPVYAGLFLIVALSSLGLPGLNGFVGEFLVLVGAFVVNRTWAIVAATGVLLAAVYLLWAYQRVFHGPIVIEANRQVRDVSARERLVLAPIVAAIVLLGVWPRPLLERMEPSLARVADRVARGSSFSLSNPHSRVVVPIEQAGPDGGGGR